MKEPFSAKRRAVLRAGLAAGLAPAIVRAQTSFNARVTFDLDRLGGTANAYVVGNNVQWAYGGDGIMLPNSLEFNPTVLEAARNLYPTMLRYPGGSQADTYHPIRGIGPLATRGQVENFFSKQPETVLLGTHEMLELCEAVGALPVFTANTQTATPQDMADWVAYIHRTKLLSRRTGRELPKVSFWEIGNEPYLRERAELSFTPDVFAERATQFIRAMKGAEPSIRVGLPLRSDRWANIPANHYPGYNDTVLRTVGAPFDWVALHNAYLPFALDRQYTDQDLFLGAMAGTRLVEEDFAATRRQLAALRPGTYGIGVTEYNAFFTSNGGPTDRYIASLAGALYVADALRLFAQTPDVWMAHYWSLLGNWYFGAWSYPEGARPSYHVLRIFRTLLQGRMVPARIESRTFNNPRVGFVPAYSGTPTIAAIGTWNAGVLRAVLINKDMSSPAAIELAVPGTGRPTRADLYLLTGNTPFASQVSYQRGSGMTVAPALVRFSQPRHSMSYIELALPR
jgi:alpha-N-arabinofuranosidase